METINKTVTEKILTEEDMKSIGISVNDMLTVECALDEAFHMGVIAGRNNEQVYKDAVKFISDCADEKKIQLLCEAVIKGNN